LRKGNLSDLMAAVNSIAGEIKLKKKRIERLEENMEKVTNLVDQILHDQ
jgi:peptidoglycan hydrolase CwlO-like protein